MCMDGQGVSKVVEPQTLLDGEVKEVPGTPFPFGTLTRTPCVSGKRGVEG